MVRRSTVVVAILVMSAVPALAIGGGGAAAQGDAVRYRLGGLAAHFTEKYGAPLEIVDHDAISGATIRTFAVFGFGDVRMVAYDRYVIGITLRPLAGEAWTDGAVDVVLEDFAPTDADYDDERLALGPDELGINRIGIAGTSDGVADEIDEAVYEAIDASGDPGAFTAILFEAAPSLYSGVSITLGTVGEPQQGLSADEQAYLDAVLPIIDTVSASLDRFTELAQDPMIGVDAWTIRVSAELVTWDQGYQQAAAIVAPPTLLGVHSAFVEALSSFDQAADFVVLGLDNLDPSALSTATNLINLGQVKLAEGNLLFDLIRVERGL